MSDTHGAERPGGARPPAAPPRPYSAYAAQLAELQKTNPPLFQSAQQVSSQLAEPNILGVHRLMQIFGQELVTQKAEEALAQFNEARERGADAYVLGPEGNPTAVATRAGKPRSQGGIFFWIIRDHCDKLGLNWFGLRIPTPFPAPWQSAPKKAKPAAPAPDSSGSAPAADASAPAPAAPAPAPAAAAQVAAPAPAPAPAAARGAQGGAPAGAPRPNRLKATVVGTPLGPPAPSPGGMPGLLQILFAVEMTAELPKGLPNLGKSRVVVFCTEKQYNRVKEHLTPTSRLIIEGEAAPILDAQGKPIVCLVCLKMTTPELEQAGRAKSAPPAG